MTALPLPARHLHQYNPTLVLWRPEPYTLHTHKGYSRMNTHDNTKSTLPPFQSALVLARHEDHAVVDRQMLRGIGIRNIRVLTSGLEAVTKLAGYENFDQGLPPPDLVLCDAQLADMSGNEFVTLLRRHPTLQSFPVVGTAQDTDPALRQKAAEAGYNALLTRPYAPSAFLEALGQAAQSAQKQREAFSPKDIKVFEEEVQRYQALDRKSSEEATRCFREGLLCLKQERWDEAARAFQKALREQADFTDAGKALAVALKKREQAALLQAQQNPERSLSKAQADALREKLSKAEAAGASPAALEGLIVASLFEDELQSTPASNETGLLRLEEKTDAQRLSEQKPEGPSRFPRLNEAVQVAKMTFGLYKNSKKRR